MLIFTGALATFIRERKWETVTEWTNEGVQVILFRDPEHVFWIVFPIVDEKANPPKVRFQMECVHPHLVCKCLESAT